MTLGKVLKWLGLVLLGLAIVLAVFIWRVGAWGALFPSSDHDVEAPVLPALTAPAVLVFSKTNGFRHVEAIDAGVPMFKEIAAAEGWSLFHTENGAVFNSDDLAKFDLVIFHCATGDMLAPAQQAAFRDWLEGGGAWMGIHSAGDGSHKAWRWYTETLIGADYNAHILQPQFQTADVVIEQPEHPTMQGLPGDWSHEEEWYSWHSSPRLAGVNVLATVDETTYIPVAKMFGSEKDLRMGDHPVIWSRCVGKGSAFYSALGHSGSTYADPQHRQLLLNAMRWSVGEGCSGQR
nr:ThuA domain-containing protein [Halioglobus maricola]